MRNPISSPTTALSNAAVAWNEKVSASSAPVLRHISDTQRALEQLQAAVDHFRALDFDEVAEQSSVGIDSTHTTSAVHGLCTRLDQFEFALAQLSEQARSVKRLGESILEDCRSLPTCPFPAVDCDQVPGGLVTRTEEKTEYERETDTLALNQLIATQRAEIETLTRQLAEVGTSPKSPGESTRKSESPRAVVQIELQSVQEFVQNSSIASVPINASYYQRILEAASSPEGHKVPMGKILTDAGVVSERQLQSALTYQRDGRRKALGSVLVDLGYTTEDAIAQALAAQLALPYVVLASEPVDPSAVAVVPVHLARRHAAFPLSFNGHGLCVAMANPLDLIALEDLRIASSMHIRPCVAARGDIASHIDRFFM